MGDKNKVSIFYSSDSLLVNTNDSIGNQLVQPTKKRKEIAPRSKVWTHFDKYVENGSKARCRYCRQLLAYTS